MKSNEDRMSGKKERDKKNKVRQGQHKKEKEKWSRVQGEMMIQNEKEIDRQRWYKRYKTGRDDKNILRLIP